MTPHARDILVYADWEPMAGPQFMGTLKATPIRGKEILSFSYDEAWLASDFAQVLDPNLGLYAGPQYLANHEKSNFGLFTDSSPDRWGRLLMRRREALVAQAGERTVGVLHESDYLLGVFDAQRSGGLRFKLEEQGKFLNADNRLAVPLWTALRSLEEASQALENHADDQDSEQLFWLNQLLAPGSSLGGARPKAGVVDPEGNLWIAKFPSKNDEVDSGAWEMVLFELARHAGIDISESKTMLLSGGQHTFLTRRFDRKTDRRRIHFASALTMLDLTDGTDHSDGVSYLDMAEFLIRNGARVEEDLEQLWRRIVFSICVSNTDDHLRNHGFLLGPEGWVLSPAFDLNPNPQDAGLTLNISENDNRLDLALSLQVCEYFRVAEARAKNIVDEIVEVVQQWSRIAAQLGISRNEIGQMRPAFMHAAQP